MEMLKMKYRPCEVKIDWLRVFLKKLSEVTDSKRPTELFEFLYEQVCSASISGRD